MGWFAVPIFASIDIGRRLVGSLGEIMRVVILGILISAIVNGSAFAKPAQHWAAVNRITMESTGDLTLKDGRLSFSNGGSVHVKLLKAHVLGQWSETNAAAVGDIYKVDPPAEPSSARGDVLCHAPATYIVLSRPVPGDVDMSVYTGHAPPKRDGSEEACATFSYTNG